MPFTLSHPVAVLPFLAGGRARGRLVTSALVCGTMAPDLPYFATGSHRQADATHSWWGVLTVDVAIVAVLVVLWYLLLRGPLVALLPARWTEAAERLTAPGPRPGPGALPWFALSAAIGAATHVGWDEFTHPDRLGTRLFPELATEMVLGKPLYTTVQYGSSAIALTVLCLYVARRLRSADEDGGLPCAIVLSPPVKRLVLAGVVAAALVGAAIRIANWARRYPDAPLFEIVATFAFGAIAGTGAALLVYAVAARAVSRRRPVRPSRGG